MDNELERFKTLTGATTQTARFCLQLSHGNFEEAVHAFYNNRKGISIDGRVRTGSLPIAEVQTYTAQQEERQQDGMISGVVHFVTAVVTSPYRGLRALAELSFRNMDDAVLADEFVRSFTHHYGSQHPTFVEMGWKEAARQAERQSRFLFAYLHAPDHEDTETFCRHVLSSNEVITFLDQNFVCWGGSIHRAPGYLLARDTGATTFPFVCLLGHNGAQVTVMASIQGKIPGMQLINILQQSLDEQGSVFVAQRAERDQRELDRQLRQDQDREYQRALEADRERDRKNREAAAARAAIEEEARLKAEQDRLNKEAEERQKQERHQAIIRRRSEAAAALKPEPMATTGIVQLRVRLPDGRAHTRKFLETDKVSDVYQFVNGLDGLHCWDYTLASSYPKIEFGSGMRDRTLLEMGVEHSAMLLVQSHDD